SLFRVKTPFLERQLMNIIAYNLKDNVNAYIMQEDGSYIPKHPEEGEEEFNVHREFFNVTPEIVNNVKLVSDLG
ncbi:UNVERIFIED_CONTAM: hypothetical protein ODX35_19560, partial [Salmonella enterica subsp. enterica serovar Enteritidis]